MASAKRLPSGSWRVLVFAGVTDGKRRYKSFTADTKKDAEYQAAEWNLKRREKKNGELTIGDAIDRYINERENILSPTTIARYRSMRKKAFKEIEKTRLTNIDKECLQRYVNQYSAGHKPKTTSCVYGLLASAIQAYGDVRYHVDLPHKARNITDIPSDEDIKRLIDGADEKMRAALLIASCMGLRRAEICALTWDDMRDGRMIVNKTYVKTSDGKWLLKSPKTFAGTRTLEIPTAMQRVLSRPQSAQATDEIIGLTPDAVTRRFERLRTRYGISFRFHDLRHYYASVMLALGVPDKYAMERMGHATPDMLKRVYQQTMNEKEKQVNSQIDGYMEKLLKP